MPGLKMRRLDFTKRSATPPLAAIIVFLLLAVGLLSAWRQWDLWALRVEVTRFESQLVERRMQHEREARRALAQSPEEKKVDLLLSAQSAEDRLRPLLLRSIEGAWAPTVAVMNLKIESAGKSAQLELMTAELAEVFAFVARLNAEQGVRATVMRHGIRSGDPNLATMAAVRVELR
ncbi:hypothetical protein AKG08_03445 [Achromobacter piechaudii]|uniref:Uncharacterized protein n=3 Tax=Achromobacter piechaudii TaxID=72556 RepID=A0A6S7E9J5_9BURK|nr:hypothetical protein [Achromobacter piechaudii]EFF76961.1 hypothetical protein HMPREF0004_1720 [Achromobacter piechaudii ATCC 43553]KNY12497.1 hypothetical protein AKG08_03445 [Achromobacter piechaudii]CAB3713365.1 hypothetical protein LMG1873_03331 [Achromobacter piechaudii]CAB3879836.1 hypothetical protein LMG2828_03415 [Achromobacter piechaudii]CAB3902612.1 hypothetical protein LMG1861_04376 [Achromobacter piechaudii]